MYAFVTITVSTLCAFTQRVDTIKMRLINFFKFIRLIFESNKCAAINLQSTGFYLQVITMAKEVLTLGEPFLINPYLISNKP